MLSGGILCAGHKSGMIGVDAWGLNINEILGVIRGGSQLLPEKLRDDVDNPSMGAREPLQFLKASFSSG